MPWQSNNGGGGDRNPWASGPRGGGAGGGRGGGQPPDFEDLVRKSQDRLKQVLPGGRPGRGLILLGVLLLLVLWGSTAIYRVNANEQGVVLRFGEWVYSTPPGLHVHLPWPIETALTPAVTDVNRTDVGFQAGTPIRGTRPPQLLEESLMLTGDENIVDIAFTVFWRINDAGQYLFNIESPQEITVKAVAESVMREIIGKTPIQSALTEGRNEIEQEARGLIQSVLDNYEAGIEVTGVKLEKVDPPAQVIDAFRDVQAAEADRERFRNQAESYANSIIPEARGEANRMIQEAEAYKEQEIARARGEAARFESVFEEYQQARDVTRKRIYVETMEHVLTNRDKIIIDEGAGSGVLPYLPLPEIQRRQQGQGGGQ